ncbi:MAG: low specificity L-threonine aldolase [Psychrilyobacter sp.]|nr:low specificity L-threonine aldolase [Psychrilyobacter sp.]
MKKSFASDNYSGVHPKIMESLIKANNGHESPYGGDTYTALAKEKFNEIFGPVETLFVYNGTASNVFALDILKEIGSAVLCPSTAHIYTDETGALAKITGMQMLTVPSQDGKLDLEEAKKYLQFKDTFHRASPNIISISQATENGTIYTLDEIKEISNFAKEHKMYLHMDGARISNAVVALGCSLEEMTRGCGVDILSFGATKNGIMFGEAVVIFDEKLKNRVGEFEYLRKQNLQVLSKMRFVAAQYITLFEENIWYENAKNGNDMAKYLEEQLLNINIKVTNEVLGNTVFAILPEKIIEQLQDFCYFYVWDPTISEVRFVMSFDIVKKDVDNFITKIKELISL